MEVISNRFAVIYYRKNVVFEKDHADNYEEIKRQRNLQDLNEDKGQLAKWYVLHKIARWPADLSENTSVPYMFSQNFKYQLDFNHKTK